MDLIGQLLDVAMMLYSTLYMSSAKVWLVVKLTDNHDRSYKLSLPLCRCLATTLWYANVASLLGFLGDLRVPTLVLDNEVALVSQFKFHEEEAFQLHLIHLAQVGTL